MPRKTIKQKLEERLRACGILNEGEYVERINRGKAGMACGAWAWHILDSRGLQVCVGSSETMKECVDADRLVLGPRSYWGDSHITAELLRSQEGRDHE